MTRIYDYSLNADIARKYPYFTRLLEISKTTARKHVTAGHIVLVNLANVDPLDGPVIITDKNQHIDFYRRPAYYIPVDIFNHYCFPFPLDEFKRLYHGR